MRFLVTGHTGFKGAWLALVLHGRGHEVAGLSLDPLPGSLYERARVGDLVARDLRGDIRDAEVVRAAVRRIAPDVVVHLAAQPLVRASYRDPRFTLETNVLGTYNVLEAVQRAEGVRAQLVVTTDKVYRNVGRPRAYREPDPLGGLDPYSASKAAADIVVQSWIASSSCEVPTAVARAGNVIGGGDVSPERLMVDLLAAYATGVPVVLRNPDAVRPWQHVLDCLNGYLMLIDALLGGRAAGQAFNFGPPPASSATVATVASRVARLWGGAAPWVHEPQEPQLAEAASLTLDSRKAERALGWRNLADLDRTLQLTVEWARRAADGEDVRALTLEQVSSFPGRGG